MDENVFAWIVFTVSCIAVGIWFFFKAIEEEETKGGKYEGNHDVF